LQKSIAWQEKEAAAMERLRRGESTLDIYGFAEILKARADGAIDPFATAPKKSNT